MAWLYPTFRTNKVTMKKELSLQQIAEIQRRNNRRLDVLNEARVKLSQDIVTALVRAHEEGKDLEGVSFDLVFPAKTAPVPANKGVEIEADEDDEVVRKPAKRSKHR